MPSQNHFGDLRWCRFHGQVILLVRVFDAVFELPGDPRGDCEVFRAIGGLLAGGEFKDVHLSVQAALPHNISSSECGKIGRHEGTSTTPTRTSSRNS